ncbi:MAG: nitroreductase [Spirochaetales bacterium]|nr:nitroreductase [Spirochaetales bacterium]
MKDILAVIRSRFSPHSFLDREVADDVVDRILEAGRLAPSAKNRQPWRFVVVRDLAKRQLISQAAYNEPWIVQAPVHVAVCSTNIDYKMPNGQTAYPIDLSFAAAFMALQAVDEGLACCINTTFDENEIRDLLTVPYGMRVVLLLILGHSDEKPTGHERLAKSRIVSFEHW